MTSGPVAAVPAGAEKIWQKSENSALTDEPPAIICSSADGGPGFPGVFYLAQREPRFVGFSKRAGFVVEEKGNG